MIDNEELPIGFTMELAIHSDILNQFSKLPKTKQDELVEGARDIKTKEAMKSYVSSMIFY